MLLRKNILSLFLTTVLCLPFFSLADSKNSKGGWIKSHQWVETRTFGGLSWRNFSYRLHPEKKGYIQIKYQGKLSDEYWDLNNNERSIKSVTWLAGYVCGEVEPGVYSNSRVPKKNFSEWYYGYKTEKPELLTARCETKEEYRERRRLADLRQADLRRQEMLLARQREAEESAEKKKLEDESLQAKKDECTSFGFEPKTNAHSECVMKLSIAEKARNKISAEADALAEQSAAESEAYRKELRRIQAERERAQREAQAAAKRQREAELLIGLGSAISSGQFPLGGSSSPTSLDEPMSTGSGRYKQCFYRVSGDRVSVSVPRAEACTATKSFGSQTGYLTR